MNAPNIDDDPAMKGFLSDGTFYKLPLFCPAGFS